MIEWRERMKMKNNEKGRKRNITKLYFNKKKGKSMKLKRYYLFSYLKEKKWKIF